MILSLAVVTPQLTSESIPKGVYLAKDVQVSMGHYASSSRVGYWSKSKVCPTSCVALAEVVNLPSKFVSSNPYFVIADTHWIVWLVYILLI